MSGPLKPSAVNAVSGMWSSPVVGFGEVAFFQAGVE
jgi:hypothetical protein